tara:strand:- start:554 stop:1705 length:1152 start_codon:yes stop_codon:yes gene_type:complete
LVLNKNKKNIKVDGNRLFFLEGIEALRGIAIILVIGFHSILVLFPGYFFRNSDYSNKGILLFKSIELDRLILNFNPLGRGGCGVTLFLVISGFLIHLIYLRSNKKKLNLKVFFQKRFWRIVPPYYIILLCFFLINEELNTTGLSNLISHVLFFHNLNDSTFFTINPSFWSIALEVQLYLLYPIFLLLRRCFSTNKILVFLIIFYILTSELTIPSLGSSFAKDTFVLRTWFVWVSGAFLAEEYFNKRRLSNYPFRVFAMLFCIYLMLSIFNFGGAYGELKKLISTASFIFLIEFSLFNSPKNSLYKILFSFLKFIGLISYSLYLIHQPLLLELIEILKPETSIQLLNTIIGYILTLSIVVVISYVSYRFLEQKSIAFGKKINYK